MNSNSITLDIDPIARKIIASPPVLEVNTGETVKWLRLSAAKKYSFLIDFGNETPFSMSQFKIKKYDDTGDLEVIYMNPTNEPKKFKYSVRAIRILHHIPPLDPELIIPKNSKK